MSPDDAIMLTMEQKNVSKETALYIQKAKGMIKSAECPKHCMSAWKGLVLSATAHEAVEACQSECHLQSCPAGAQVQKGSAIPCLGRQLSDPLA